MNIFLLFVLCRSILVPKLKVFQIESILKVEYLLKPQDYFGHLQFWRENSNHFDDDSENVIYRYALHYNGDIMTHYVCHIRSNFLFFYSCLAYLKDVLWLHVDQLEKNWQGARNCWRYFSSFLSQFGNFFKIFETHDFLF